MSYNFQEKKFLSNLPDMGKKYVQVSCSIITLSGRKVELLRVIYVMYSCVYVCTMYICHLNKLVSYHSTSLAYTTFIKALADLTVCSAQLIGSFFVFSFVVLLASGVWSAECLFINDYRESVPLALAY